MHAATRDRGSPLTRPLSRWTPETVLAVGLLALYLALLKGHLDSVDGLIMYRQGTSLVLRHSIHLVPNVQWGVPIGNSWYGIGQSLLYAPFIGLIHLFGLNQAGASTTGSLRQFYSDPLWTASCSWMNAVVTAVTACCVGKSLRALAASETQIVLGVLAFGLGSPALTFSGSSFAQPVAALTVAVTVVCLLRWTGDNRVNRVLLAVAIGVCVITRLPEGIILVVGSLLFLVARRSRWSSLAWPIAGLAIGGAVDLAVDWLRFGSPLNTGYGANGWTMNSAGVLGLSISPGRGILWYMPFCVLVPLGLARLIRRGRRREAAWLGGTAFLLFVNAALWDFWWGGLDWGPRLLVPALPVIAVIGAFGVSTRWSRVTAVAAIVGGFVLLLPTVLVDVLAVPSASSHTNFRMSTVPALSAWSSLDHVVPRFATDRFGIDVLWLRMSHHGSDAVLLVPFALVAVALWLLAKGCSAARPPSGQEGGRAGRVARSAADPTPPDPPGLLSGRGPIRSPSPS